MTNVGVARRSLALMFVTATLASCSGSGHPTTEQVSLSGRSSAGTFDAIIGFPSTARAGETVNMPMSFSNTGGNIVSFQFDIAVDGPPQCAITNMMAWSAVRDDLRPGAEAAVIRDNHLAPNTDLRTLGLWPESGFNLRNGDSTRTTRTFQVPQACHGTVDFVAVARPYGKQPITRHLRVTVT